MLLLKTSITMGKTKNGVFVPPKGKPSGSGREGSGLKDAFAVTDLKKDEELAERFMQGPDETSDNVSVRHPNRNVNKGREDESDQ